MTIKVRRIVFVVVIIILLTGLAWLIWIGGKTLYREYLESRYPLMYTDVIEEYAEKNGLSPSLVYAVVRCESGFTPEAVSSIGARGMMQITEETFDWILFRMGGDRSETYDDMFDPETNIEFGTYLLKMLSDEFENTEAVLCAYHAGRSQTIQWLSDPKYSDDGVTLHTIPYKDTSGYVKNVMSSIERYKELYGVV